MKTFPMFLRMAGRRVVIAGGGEQAAQKCRLMLKTEAEIVVLATSLEPELKALQKSGAIIWRSGPISVTDFEDAALVFLASGCPAIDASLYAVVKAAGALVNVVDQPDLCDAMTPSIVDRDPVVVAIGTEGTAPVLARQIKTRVEQLLEPRLGDLASIAGRLRGDAAMRLGSRSRRDLWKWVFSCAPRRAHARGAEREAARMIKNAIWQGSAPEVAEGVVSAVNAGAGAPDLMTLRGVQRLQEADIIFHSHTIDQQVLELARRDAERVRLGASGGCSDWPLNKSIELIVSAARRGKRVVWLHGVDQTPGPRDVKMIAMAGVVFEAIPGVAFDRKVRTAAAS